MKGKIFVGAAILVLSCALYGAAQQPARIQFAKGRNSAVVQGTTGPHGKMYVVRARSGQKLILAVTPRTGVGIKVETNGSYGHQILLREKSGGIYEIGLEETGDHTIFLGSMNGRPANFKLTVKIVKMTDI